jgi:predicted nucleic-acid-binding Zn-ribbon protein|tara:strand:- start:315 stop:512 length:198 start_codon:yes stop_codon:yes gene_type:complete
MSKRFKIQTMKSWIANRSPEEKARLTELYSKKESTYQGNILDKMVTEMAKADAQKQYETKQQLNK